jgi:hypothetical protein
MLVIAGVQVPDVAFGTQRFTVTISALYDPFPDEYYRHFKIGKSARKRYEHFDALSIMVDISFMGKKTKDAIKAASAYVAARDYYRSKCRRKR